MKKTLLAVTVSITLFGLANSDNNCNTHGA